MLSEGDLEKGRLGIEQEKPNGRELDDLCEESGDESDEAGEGDLTRFLIVGVLVSQEIS